MSTDTPKVTALCPRCKRRHRIKAPPEFRTRRQVDVARAIVAYTNKHGIRPGLADIGESLGICKIAVFEHVARMRQMGLLSKAKRNQLRSLQLADGVAIPEEFERTKR